MIQSSSIGGPCKHHLGVGWVRQGVGHGGHTVTTIGGQQWDQGLRPCSQNRHLTFTEGYEYSRWILNVYAQGEYSRWILKVNTQGEYSRWILKVYAQGEYSRWILKVNTQGEYSRCMPSCIQLWWCTAIDTVSWVCTNMYAVKVKGPYPKRGVGGVLISLSLAIEPVGG